MTLNRDSRTPVEPPYVNAWRNVRFQPERVVRPASRDELIDLVHQARAAGRRLKPLGGGHSFNHLLKTDGWLIDLGLLNQVVSIDRREGTVELEGGVTLGDAIVALDREGLHFPSLGSWYTQSISGAIATSTHGSSLAHGSLSDCVLEVEAVLADGSVLRVGGDDERAKALRVHLGQLGCVTRVKLQVEPSYWLECSIRAVPDVEGFASILELARAHEYVNMLWIPYTEEACIRVLNRTEARERNQAALELENRFVGRSRLGNTVEDLGVFLYGHAYLRLPRLLSRRYSTRVRAAFFDDQGVVDKSYRVFLYDQYREPTENHELRLILNAEYAIDVARLEPVLRQIKEVLERERRQGRYINYPRVHVRFAPASDRTLIGLNAGRETAYVGIYIVGSIQHAPQIPIAQAIEQVMIDHEGRPHWGKYRYVDSGRFEQTYPEGAAFQRIRRSLDPEGLFSDGAAMFQGLDRFPRPRLGRQLASLFRRDTYRSVRLL